MSGEIRRRYEQALSRLRQAEDDLDTQQSFSDQLLATMPAVVVVLDDRGRIVYINPFMESLSGYRLAEVLDQDWFETFLPERDRGPIRELFTQAIGGVQTRANTNAIVTRSGEERLIQWFDHRLPAWAGNEHWLLASGVDITGLEPERRRSRPGEAGGDPAGQVLAALCRAVEARDPRAAGHQRRVADLAEAIGRRMGLDAHRLQGLRLGASIHDIGHLQVPAGILAKPSGLNAAERQALQAHAGAGFEILKDLDLPWPLAAIVHQHHERLDGSGYPQGLKGDQIGLEARIVAVADVMETMGSHRPCRDGQGDGLGELRHHRGRRFDADATDACMALFADGFRF